jgi:MSHA biogenesis protein MshO
MRRRGFTLVELIVVIAITGIIAASVTLFLVPAMRSYFDAKRRADLSNMADTALRRMSFDIRRAVPNSIVPLKNGTCFSLVPTAWGGRYRMAADTANDVFPSSACTAATCSAPLAVGSTMFDVLAISPPSPASAPSVGDFVVIDNQNGNDVYAGTNRAAITAYATPAATRGLARITMGGAPLPAGYEGGRFMVVASAEQVVYYSCSGGTLYRRVLDFSTVAGAAADSFCGSGAPVATASAVACTFVFDSGVTATQQNGLVWMNLSLRQDDETVSLAHSTNVPNVP